MDEIQSINLSVDINNKEESLFEIYKQLRPDAEKSKTVFKELKGGFINLSYILYPENELEKAIVFRTFGKKFNEEEMQKLDQQFKQQGLSDEPKNFEKIMFNRTSEAYVMHSISKCNLCKPVYAKYLNGMCFGYAQGITAYGPLMLTDDYLNQLSSKLAKLHSIEIEIPDMIFKTHYDKMIQQFGPSMKPIMEFVANEVEKIKEYPYTEFPKFLQIIMEEELLKKKIEEVGMGEIGFCHNDLNQKNVIWNPQERELFFIDFEMSMNNYIAYELGQIFFSFSGHFLQDFIEDFLPNENYRLNFIRRYLEEKYKIKNKKIENDVFENEVKLLFIRSNICLLMFLIKIVIMTPFVEFRPDIFKNEELDEAKSKISYLAGRYGLSIWKTYIKMKEELLKPLDDYLIKKQ